MPADDRVSDQHERIERLKAQAAAIDERMVVYESDSLTPDVREQFWRNVVELETAETTDLVKELTAIGVPLPEPDGLDDDALHAALWNTIHALARLGVFLDQTDHLNDRELYTHLLRDQLPQEMPELDMDGSWWHIDILGGGSCEDVSLYLKYYADEATRERWRNDFPDDVVPDHEQPPYERDRHLPRLW
jgi:hypothetical protein